MRHTSLFVLYGKCNWHSSHLSGVAGRQGKKMVYMQSLLSLSQQQVQGSVFRLMYWYTVCGAPTDGDCVDSLACLKHAMLCVTKIKSWQQLSGSYKLKYWVNKLGSVNMSAVPAGMCTTIRHQEALLVAQQAAAHQKPGDHAPLKSSNVLGLKQGPNRGRLAIGGMASFAISIVIIRLPTPA